MYHINAFVELMAGDSNQQSNDIYDACIRIVYACIQPFAVYT